MTSPTMLVDQALVAQVKEKFPDAKDLDIRRFIASSDGKLEGKGGAIERFDVYTKWKAALPSLDALYKDSWVEIEKKKVYVRGVDKKGHMVIYWQTDKNDPKKRDLDVMLNGAIYWVLQLEKQLDDALENGRPVFEFSIVVDRTNNVLDLPFVRACVPLFANNFPERLANIYICPAPFVFRALWAIISPWFNDKTRERVKMVGTCKDLQEFIAPDQLPVRMEGTDDWEYDPLRDTPTPDSAMAA